MRSSPAAPAICSPAADPNTWSLEAVPVVVSALTKPKSASVVFSPTTTSISYEFGALNSNTASAIANRSTRWKVRSVLATESFSSSPSTISTAVSFITVSISSGVKRRPSSPSATLWITATMPAICGAAILVPWILLVPPFSQAELTRAPGAKMSDNSSSRCEK